MNIQENYVSFETAKLLKEKGFPQSKDIAMAMYNEVGMLLNLCTNTEEYYVFEDFDEHDCIAVSQAMAMKWLREVHKKWITITFHWHTVDGETTLYYSPYIMLSKYNNVVLEDKNPFKMKLFNSYEQACEAAIKYCLENLLTPSSAPEQ